MRNKGRIASYLLADEGATRLASRQCLQATASDTLRIIPA